MKKIVSIGAVLAFAVLSLSILFMVACNKKEVPKAPTGLNSYVSGSSIKLYWNNVDDADSYYITNGEGNYIYTAYYSTSYTDNSPQEGNNYYRVYSQNEYGRSSSFSSTSYYYSLNNGGGGGNSSAPSSPSGVSASVSGSSICITWNTVSNAIGYNVERSESGSVFQSIGTTSDNHIYDTYPYENNYYRVKAYNDNGESGWSSSVYCHYSSGGGGGGGNSAPSAPTGVSAEVSGSKIKVSWNSVSNATSYTVYWSANGGNYSSIESTSNTYYYDYNPSEDNYYKVKAENSYGVSSFSSYAYCHYTSGGGGGTTVPDAPTGVYAENIGSTMVPDIKITWNSVSNATGYKVYKSTSPNSGYTQHGSETTTTYFYDHNPSQGNNYYKVKAVNSAGESSYSSFAVVNINSNNVAPCPPTVSASGTTSSITVSWTSSTSTGCGRPTSYKVYKRNPSSSSYELKTTTTSTSYRDTDVHPGYNRYAVEAINDYGSDEGYGYSSEIPLSKPSSFSAQKSGNDRIIFSWSRVNQATGYEIFMSQSAYGTYYTFNGTDENVTSLNVYYPGESGHTYYFKIRAYYRESYGTYIFSDFTTYKSVTF